MAMIQQTFAFLQAEDAGKIAAPKPRFVERKKYAVTREPKLQHAPLGESLALPLGNSHEPVINSPDDRHAVLRQLRAAMGCVSTAPAEAANKLSTGCQAIDAMLPGGGLKANTITEWIAQSDSSGAAALSLITAANCLRSRSVAGPLLVVDLDKTFYPPAAAALGIPMEQIILVRPGQHADMVWAIDQALRCEAVSAVWAHIGARLDDRDARRFQLAAEVGKTPGFFVRSKTVRGRPSFVEVRFHVNGTVVERSAVETVPGKSSGEAEARLGGSLALPLTLPRLSSPNRLHKVTLDRCRGGVIGQSVDVQIDDQARVHHVSFTKPSEHETAAVHLASQLANPPATQQAVRRRA